MIAASMNVRPEELAQTLFGIFTRFAMSRPRGRTRKGSLKEAEFLTLAILHQHETRIVGDIQRRLAEPGARPIDLDAEEFYSDPELLGVYPCDAS